MNFSEVQVLEHVLVKLEAFLGLPSSSRSSNVLSSFGLVFQSVSDVRVPSSVQYF